jgi:integrase
MASVNKDSKGWRVEFTVPGQRRRPLRLGQVTEKSAREIGRHVERIIESKKTGLPVAAETENWVAVLPDELRRKLVAVGLVANSGRRGSRILGQFLDDYITARSDIKQGTINNLIVARRHLEKYFGPDRDMATITAGEADLYRIWLGSKGKQGEMTVRRLCSRARQFFRAALRQELISTNPFGDMEKLAVGASPKSRAYLIDSPTAQKVLDACPDSHWRVVFALARYGGLRVPSEVCALKWEHIDWENDRIHSPCPKTEHYVGKEIRPIPLFPEIRRELEAWRSMAPMDQEFVLRPLVGPKTNLRTGLINILKRAGIKPWPKLFQNLRSTRATELRDRFPTHVVAAWLGHTVKVADAHYNQVTDEHYRRAVEAGPKEEPPAHGAA